MSDDLANRPLAYGTTWRLPCHHDWIQANMPGHQQCIFCGKERPRPFSTIPAVRPKVKPLVWYGKPADFYMFADTAFGLYEIGVEHGDEWFSDFTDHKSGKPVRLSSWQDGSIAPQAAAQADYEARILSALEPAVQPDAALKGEQK